MKPCRKCGGAEFYFRKNGKRQCKACKKEKAREWKKNNPEKVREHTRKWKKNNPEKVREHTRKSHKNNREKELEKQRRRRGERWLKCIAIAGGVCQLCKEAKAWQIMSFHHVYPAQKERNPTDAVSALDFAELDKCALLCVEHHAAYEFTIWDGNWRKRPGDPFGGYELTVWWYNFSYDGPRDAALMADPRYRNGVNGQ